MPNFNTNLLLITPPFTQLNTPYPATAFLKGFFNQYKYSVEQADLGIDTLLQLFKKEGLAALFNNISVDEHDIPADKMRMIQLKEEYIDNIETVVKFLQGKDNTLAQSIVNGRLPKGKRFETMQDTEWLFGTLGSMDLAKYLCTLFVEDIGDFISECVDGDFAFSRYAERIGLFNTNFDRIATAIEKNSIVTDTMLQILDSYIEKHQPQIVGFSVPFPGNLFGAIKSAQHLKEKYPDIKIAMGGGFANTELRQLSDVRLFEYIDFVCLDDGEATLLRLLDCVNGKCDEEKLVRTYIEKNGVVQYINDTNFKDFPHAAIGTPDYLGLPLADYISVLDMPNPMHRLWSDGRWNKMAIAHGCYWHKCSFCDTSLDYIKRYSQTNASVLCDRIEQIIEQTGTTGFHFVDEAAPPLQLRNLALEILKRRLKISWWTNIRFEKSFSSDLCRLLAASGCIAITGGLEVASDRLLTLMNKGVDIKQVTQTTHNFSNAGILVHSYLMYGFPTQTEQETIDALEVVRQLFENKLLQSAFWHQFVMTIHSPVGMSQEEYHVKAKDNKTSNFANNDLPHEDPSGCEHEKFSFGLKKALYNYMSDLCFDFDLSEWFDFYTPPTTLAPNLIENILLLKEKKYYKAENIVVWMGNKPSSLKGKKGKTRYSFDNKAESYSIELKEKEGKWLETILERIHISSDNYLKMEEIEKSFSEITKGNFKDFINKNVWKTLCKYDMYIV